MIRSLAAQLAWKRYLSRNALDTRPLESFLTFNPAEQRKQLAARLLKQIQYFGNRQDALPEWKEAARISNPDELWRIWPSLPIVTKRDLQTRFIAAEIGKYSGLPGRVDSTGGSTGEPVRFYHDRDMTLAGVALNIWTRQQMGWRPGMPTVIIWGAERDIGKSLPRKVHVMNWVLRDVMLDGYHLRDTTAQRLAEVARTQSPVAVYGFTSMLEFMAREVLRQGIEIRKGSVAVAWNGGEMLFDQQNEVFQQAFHTPILNRYGGRELSAMACQFKPFDPLRVLRPWQFVEIVDEHGKPVPPGESGRLLWTSTICRGTPFLRYEIEDMGTAAVQHQDESGIFALTNLDGRISGLLKLADGRVINNIFWNHAFKEFSEIHQFQVRVRKDESLRILLRGPGMTADREAALRKSLNNLLHSLIWDFEWVTEIPLNASRKLVQVVRE